MDWYIRKSDGAVFGPVDLPTLQFWATEARIAPEDEVSQDQEQWQAAPDMADLHMDWFLLFDENDHYGPMHLMAMRHMIQSGELDPHTPIAHRKSRERHEAGTALLTVLIHHTQRLHQDLETAAESMARLEQELASAPQTPPPPAAEGSFQDILLERDTLRKEAHRWKQLFETEQQRGREAESQYDQEIRAARREAVEMTSRIEKLRLQLEQANKRLDAINRSAETGDEAAGQAAQISTMMDSYNELSRSYDTLLQQLRSKNEELKAVQETRSSIEKRADERVRQMHEQLRREQEEADKARQNLAEIEESHLQLVRSYRELNDRYIRLRQNMPPQESLHSGPPHQPESGQTDAGDDEDPGEEGWKPRVRLNRS